ncbi:MAG: hypothetical protein ACERKD_15370 [Prolixibacteraceae bacterium]
MRICLIVVFGLLNFSLFGQRKHAIEMMYSNSATALNRVLEERELFHADVRESTEIVSDSLLSIYNSEVETKLKSQYFGVGFNSLIPFTRKLPTCFLYGVGGGLHHSSLLHGSGTGNTGFLSYEASEPGWFAFVTLSFTYSLTETWFIEASGGSWFMTGVANKVTDANFGFDHPSFVEKHNNEFSIFNIYATLQGGYRYEKWQGWLGPAYHYSNIVYDINRVVTDLDWDENTEEIIKYGYRNLLPLTLHAGCSYALFENWELTAIIDYNTYCTVKTMLSFNF